MFHNRDIIGVHAKIQQINIALMVCKTGVLNFFEEAAN